MYNFTYHNPTKIVFGKGEISRLAKLLPLDKNIMLTFGGGSVKKNGVYEQVIKALSKHKFIEFWGIEPNPTIQTLRKAIAIGKENKIDYLLAVGGGSTIDGTKLIASGICYDGDAWDIVLKGSCDKFIPLAAVLTLPATGSEMNAGAVISNTDTKEKFPFHSQYPQFSILDPETTYSLPPYQISCGLVDTFVHIIEQYLTTAGQSRNMDRWAEGILQTIIEIAPLIQSNPKDYDLMADFMLSATLALNDMVAMGVSQDWTTHMIGHELTAINGITHGESLAIVLPATMSVLREQKKDKLLQYAKRVLNITSGSDDNIVTEAINQTRAFFKSLNLATTLTEAKFTDADIDYVAAKFNKRGVKLGEVGNVTGDVVKQILLACK
ncbi:MAG: iron-containing alcohol dehydrogenase [Ignavibacteria bacterium]|jgi:NADP-dependent alcohol dehydrogenase|nr:iron-containing alcohol dehydrogenase [Ignavibacteria bacterium]